MADGDASSNTAIVAIVVIILILLALLYFFGIFGPRETTTAPAGDRTRIEQPTGTTTRDTTTIRETTGARDNFNRETTGTRSR